jgi:hypothetical protein
VSLSIVTRLAGGKRIGIVTMRGDRFAALAMRGFTRA